MSSLADETRAAAAARPFLRAALAAGVVNYAAAARYLDVDGDEDAVATALRRYAETLDLEVAARRARVTMQSGLTPVETDAETDAGDAGGTDALLSVGGVAFASGGGSLTGVLATGDVDAGALGSVLGRLEAADVDPAAAGVAGETLVVVVPRRDGATAVRAVEDALDAVVQVSSKA